MLKQKRCQTWDKMDKKKPSFREEGYEYQINESIKTILGISGGDCSTFQQIFQQ